MIPDVIVVLTSGLFPVWVNDTQEVGYRTTTYEDSDSFGTLGGYDRIIAASILAREFPSAPIITTSSLGNKNFPSHALVARQELVSLGVEPHRILLEEVSSNLSSQLIESMKIVKENNWRKVLFLTSKYHVDRTKTQLCKLFLCDVEGLRVLSSEKVIHGNGHDYLGKFLGVLDSKEYKRRVENEMNGVNALNMGGYVSAPILLKHEKTSRRAILISGVSSGLGESFFRRAVIDESLDIFCLSRNFLPYQEKFAKERNNIFLVQIDLANIDKLSKILKKLAVCLSGYKKITFINNAGSIAPVDHIGKLDAGEIISSVAVNYTSPMLLVNMLAGLEEVYLDLINITTGAARAPVEGWSVYSSSKAAAFMFFEVLTAQCERNHKGRVEQIDPGVVNTKMQSYIRGITADKFPRVSEFIRLGDFGKLANPDSIAFKIFDEYIK